MVHPVIMAAKSDQNSAVNWTPLLASSSLLLSRRPHTEISVSVCSLTSISWPKISSFLLSFLTSDATPLNTKYWNSSKKKKLSEKNQTIIESLSHSKTQFREQQQSAIYHSTTRPPAQPRKLLFASNFCKASLNVGNSRSKEFEGKFQSFPLQRRKPASSSQEWEMREISFSCSSNYYWWDFHSSLRWSVGWLSQLKIINFSFYPHSQIEIRHWQNRQ